MINYDYVEDLFVDFYSGLASSHRLEILSKKDQAAALNFFQIISSNKEFTRPQANYLIRILKMHEVILNEFGLDVQILDDPTFKNQFRILDSQKKIYVEYTNNDIWICVKQPYTLKESFENACIESSKSFYKYVLWLSEERIRKYNLKIINVVLAKEFCQKNLYEIDQNLLDLSDIIEEIWNEQESILKKITIDRNEVKLINASESAIRYFENHKTGNIKTDLLIAKSIGHALKNPSAENVIEILASYNESIFWVNDVNRLIKICLEVNDRICFLVSREKSGQWLQEFVKKLIDQGFNNTDIKICFRTSNMEKPEFNLWIKENGHGGNVDEGKILFFKEKPPKWLIEKENYVKLVMLNGPFAPSSIIIQSWLEQQSCVVFFSEIEPSIARNSSIVKL